jgi:hypothetical protein
VITAPPLISSLYESLLHPLSLFPARRVFNSRFLVTDVNSGHSSAFCAQILPVRRIFPLLNSQLPLSKSQSYFTTGGLPPISLGVKPLETHDQTLFFFQLNSSGNSPYVTSSLTRRWVCLVWICLAFRQVWADLVPSLYSGGTDPRENSVCSSSSIVAMGGYLAISRILLAWLPAVTKQRMFLLAIVG